MSSEWTDSGHLLAEVIQSGRGVITWGRAPEVLGIETDATVRAWVGANVYSTGSDLIKTVTSDSILGDIVPGTIIGNSGKFGADALDDISGHNASKVLARHNSGTSTIAILRNRLVGQSVYFSNAITGINAEQEDIILRAVGELSVRTIPATSTWASHPYNGSWRCDSY
jgi:hypothetical protein